jgi:hypothetical protein
MNDVFSFFFWLNVFFFVTINPNLKKKRKEKYVEFCFVCFFWNFLLWNRLVIQIFYIRNDYFVCVCVCVLLLLPLAVTWIHFFFFWFHWSIRWLGPSVSVCQISCTQFLCCCCCWDTSWHTRHLSFSLTLSCILIYLSFLFWRRGARFVTSLLAHAPLEIQYLIRGQETKKINPGTLINIFYKLKFIRTHMDYLYVSVGSRALLESRESPW